MMAENCCLLYHYNAFLVNLKRIGMAGSMISQPWYHIIRHIIPVIRTIWTPFAMVCCHKCCGIHDVFLDPAIISVTLRKPSLGINSDTTYSFTFTCNSLRSNDMWQWHVTSIGIPFEICRFFLAIFLSLHGLSLFISIASNLPSVPLAFFLMTLGFPKYRKAVHPMWPVSPHGPVLAPLDRHYKNAGSYLQTQYLTRHYFVYTSGHGALISLIPHGA